MGGGHSQNAWAGLGYPLVSSALFKEWPPPWGFMLHKENTHVIFITAADCVRKLHHLPTWVSCTSEQPAITLSNREHDLWQIQHT
jgi:hypothetical protein